ncbi:MAG: YciI family protein [Chitinophagaceae bacterium]
MEKFMLIFQGGMAGGQRSPEEMQAHMGKWMTWIDKLAKAGKYIAGEPLIPGGKLVSGANKSVTDGPYTEGKEIVGGFFLINAVDMAEAVEISKDCPDLEFGTSVQVRQVMKMDM